jgi:hypothetical protein
MASYTQTQYEQLKRQRAFAWAKYYSSVSTRADDAIGVVGMLQSSGIERHRGELIRPDILPPHITSAFMEMAERLNQEHTCPVCLELVSSTTIHLTWCGHIMCKTCYEQLKTSSGTGKPNCTSCRKKI